MENKCVIFSGAVINDISEIDRESFIISADGGYDNAVKFGITPNIALGDFDTIPCEKVKDCEVIKYPAEKDDTDTLIAVKKALELGYNDIQIIGALGGRFDHTFANIQTLCYIAEKGAEGCIIGDDDMIFIQKNCLKTYQKKDGYSFSVFSITPESFGVTLKGLKYEVEDVTLTNTFPIGVSNEFTEKTCSVEVKNGVLLVILSKIKNLL